MGLRMWRNATGTGLNSIIPTELHLRLLAWFSRGYHRMGDWSRSLRSKTTLTWWEANFIQNSFHAPTDLIHFSWVLSRPQKRKARNETQYPLDILVALHIRKRARF